jgi:hypothetical protein
VNIVEIARVLEPHLVGNLETGDLEQVTESQFSHMQNVENTYLII